MSTRKELPEEVETQILTQSGRRCAFCFGLNNSLEEKTGQIAHINRDASDSRETNLAFLCLNHHDQYDKLPSQSKGLRPKELQRYKRLLLEAIARGEHGPASLQIASSQVAPICEHDRNIFRRSDRLMKEVQLAQFLGDLGSDHSHNRKDRLRVQAFIAFFAEAGNTYLGTEVRRSLEDLVDQLEKLCDFLGAHFFWYPEDQTPPDIQYCLHPDLNIERNGTGSDVEEVRYTKFEMQLNDLIQAAEKGYRSYRLHVKEQLFL